MKSTISYLMIFILSLASGCGAKGFGGAKIKGSGNIITQKRDVSEFHAIKLSGKGKLIITQGKTESLTIETDENLMQYLQTQVKDKTLHLKQKDVNLSPSKDILYKIDLINLKEIVIRGSGKVVASTLKGDNLVIQVHGAGHIKIDSLIADKFDLEIGGSGKCFVAGKVTEQNIKIGGSGKYNAPKLDSKTTAIKIGGSGNVTVRTSDTLNIAISGSGNVNYYGNPKKQFSISGSGKTKHLKD